ncbi:MAG: POTRA domain-containing protein [Bacteroidota bacterium]
MRILILLFIFFSSSLAAQDVIIKAIAIDGNKITKDFIVLRELPFQQGDTLKASELQAFVDLGKRNLVNTELFSISEITIVPAFDNEVVIVIELKEQWYIFPTPIFQLADPNFNIWWQTKDFSRANYGISYLQKNFRGRDERLSVKLQFGYSESFRLKYEIPGVNKKRTLGLLVDAEYSQFGEVTTGTSENVRVFFDDQSGKTKEQTRFGIGLLNRPQFYMSQLLYIGYDAYKVVDSLLILAPDHLNNGSNRLSFMEIGYKIRYDNLDFIAYPQEGVNWAFEAQLKGIGAAKENKLVNLFFDLGVHNRIYDRLVLQNGFRAKRTFYDQLPYTLQRGLGYNDIQARGFGLYLVDGQAYYLFRNNIKYNIIEPFEIKVGKKKRDIFTYPFAFYVNLFADFAYVEDKLYAEQNFLDNKWLKGYGIGLDVVSKYNRVFRIEYSLNDIREQGIFLQFKRSI